MKIFAYVVSALIGFAIGHYLLAGAAAAYTSILISYHLYLVYLIVSAEHEKGFSLPIGQTIVTHAAFLALLIGLPYMREHIPFFGLVALLVPSLAPFETMWLFSGQGQTFNGDDEQKPRERILATAADHQEFLVYLRGSNRRFSKPGRTVDDEFKAWHADRIKRRGANVAMASPSSGHNQPQG
jgi:hypothetical protein